MQLLKENIIFRLFTCLVEFRLQSASVLGIFPLENSEVRLTTKLKEQQAMGVSEIDMAQSESESERGENVFN